MTNESQGRSPDLSRFREAGEREFPDLPWIAATDSSLGVDNIVLDLDGQFIFRFPRAEENALQLEKEICLLPLLNRFVRLPTPSLEFVGKGTGSVRGPFVGYRKIGGSPLPEVPPPGGLDAIADAIDELLGDLARVPEPSLREAGLWGSPREDWKNGFVEWIAQWGDFLLTRLPPEVRRRLREDWDTFLSDPENFAFSPVLLHRDLTQDHILWNGTQVSGVIDWGDASMGDPAYDLTGLGFLGPARLEALAGKREELLGRGWRKRLEFYRRRRPQNAAIAFSVARPDRAQFERCVQEIARVLG